MCGFCGIAYADQARPVDLARLRAMRESIAHRGPDGAGLEHWPGVGLAHRRLAIIDVAGGQQPLSNEDGTVWVAFNGEIYNYHELTAQLIRAGHHFKTRSDTEVLVHAYEEYGVDFVRRLNGIFAFALYDRSRHRILLARDHVGVKPLFYSVTTEGLFFGSEIKAVLAGSGLRARARQDALGEYLAFRYIAGSRSFFEDVNRLPAGHIAVWQAGKLSISSYWSLPATDETREISLAEAVEALDDRLGRAVQAQMMSEVPLGTFCSGGVDSGLITGYASRASAHRLHTFSVGFADPRWDETSLASDTAARFSTDHHVLVADPSEFQAAFSRLLWYFDEPLNHPNSIPIYLLSRFARQRVTVVLTGEGSDELFAGYPRYHIGRLRARFGPTPSTLLRTMAGATRLFRGHRANLLAEVLPLRYIDSIVLNSRYVDPRLVSRLVGYDVMDTLTERRELAEKSVVPGDGVASITRYDLFTYLGSLLDRIDRMSMSSGLEARVPFLDLTMIEWGLRLHSSLKIRGWDNKRVVKHLARRTLHRRITDGAKSGFGVPLGAWFRSASFQALVARLRDPDHPAAGLFDRQELARLLDAHMSGAVDNGQVLWLLANVYLWQEVHAAAPSGSLHKEVMSTLGAA